MTLPRFTQHEIGSITQGIFTGSDSKDRFSPALIHVGKVLLKTMKETLDHNLEMNQGHLKILTSHLASVPCTMLFCFESSPTSLYSKPKVPSRLSFKPSALDCFPYHFIVMSLPWVSSAPTIFIPCRSLLTIFCYYFSSAFIIILQLHEHLLEIRTLSNVHVYFDSLLPNAQ